MSTQLGTKGFLCFQSNPSTALIQQWRGNVHFIFLGGSCSTNAPATYENLTMLSVEPQKGKGGIVAVAVTAEADERGRADYQANFLLPVSFEQDKHDGKPWVENEDPFVPAAGRLGGILNKGGGAMLSVKIAGNTYVYPPLCLSANTLTELTKKGYIVVSDGSVLCRYLTGDATPAEVEQMVVARPNEKSISERLAEAQTGLESLKSQLQFAEIRSKTSGSHCEVYEKLRRDLGRVLDETDEATGMFASTDKAKVRRISLLLAGLQEKLITAALTATKVA